MSDDNKDKEATIKFADVENFLSSSRVKSEFLSQNVDNKSSGNVGLSLSSDVKPPAINFENAPPITATTGKGLLPAPNSKPRERVPDAVEKYVYRDFANAEPADLSEETTHKRMPPQSLQNQKLPSKLAAMLSDPDLAAIITWMPHGRSWKILNRELFSSFALPPYFGHSNYASFVRIINAWGFRRISVGVDRDSYYHELFLRGKPRLHERMKRLPSCHRKTPLDKDGKCPDFNELSKASPLPEVGWNSNTNQRHNNLYPGVPAAPAMGGGAYPSLGGSYLPEAVKPVHFGGPNGAFSSMNGVGGTTSSYNMTDKSPMSSLLAMNDWGRSSNGSHTGPPPSTDVSSYAQILQRQNENLMLKIKLLEYEKQARQQKQQPQEEQQQQQPSTEGADLMLKIKRIEYENQALQQKQQQDQGQQQLPTANETPQQSSAFGETSTNIRGGGWDETLGYNANSNFSNQM